MEIIPSIDIKDGKVVRLYQGDFGRETVYSQEPVNMALRWQDAGATRIHVVDLDGARTGHIANLKAIESLISEVAIPVQLGGGIRSLETAQRLLEIGVQRVVFGTAAVRDPELVELACRDLGSDVVIVGVDARDGMVAVQGWSETTSIAVSSLIQKMARVGVGRFIFTDVATDGTLQGPNVLAVEELTAIKGIKIISSGGIGSVDDIELLTDTGIEGVILGSSLYQGTIDLKEAVRRFTP